MGQTWDPHKGLVITPDEPASSPGMSSLKRASAYAKLDPAGREVADSLYSTARNTRNLAALGGGSGGGRGPTGNSPIDNFWGERPDRQSVVGPDGKLKSQYQMNLTTGDNFDQAQNDINYMRNFAQSTDDSPWAAAARNKLSLDQSSARSDLSHQSAAQLQGSMSNLGATGGYGGGARERMARGANRNKMAGMQGIHKAGMLGGAQIGMQDANMKTSIMGQLPGQEMGLEQYKGGLDKFNNSWNKGALMNDVQAGNDWNMGQWNQKGAMIGSGMMADAMGRGGGGGIPGQQVSPTGGVLGGNLPNAWDIGTGGTGMGGLATQWLGGNIAKNAGISLPKMPWG